jgi:hypothetical protein
MCITAQTYTDITGMLPNWLLTCAWTSASLDDYSATGRGATGQLLPALQRA